MSRPAQLRAPFLEASLGSTVIHRSFLTLPKASLPRRECTDCHASVALMAYY
jgi:hypothetical protein